MESIQQKSGESTAINKDMLKDFYGKLNELSQIQKLKLIYTYFTSKKPDPLMGENKILNRILYETEYGQKIRETERMLKDQKQFKFPFMKRRELEASKKAKDMVLVFYLNIRSELEWPKAYPVYGTNMIIIRNKPYLFDPRAVLTFGKYKCIVIREIDRKPICNLDYAEVKARGDSTESDELLIKAALKAMLGGQKKDMSKIAIIIVIIIVLALGAFFLFGGGGSPAA